MGAQGVQQHGAGLAIGAARPWRTRRPGSAVAWSRTLTSVSSPSGSAEASAQATRAEVIRSLGRGCRFGAITAAGDPGPAAVLVLHA